MKCHIDYDQFTTVTIYFTVGLAQVISDHCFVAITELLTSDWQRYLNQPRMCPYFGKHLFCKTRTDYAKGRQESQQPTGSQIITICIEIPHSAAFAGIISKKLLSFYIFQNLLKVQFFPSQPGTQAQLQLFTLSIHVPLFSHGLG